MTLNEALDVLRLDSDSNNDIVEPLIAALPDFIELTTGIDRRHFDDIPLVKTLEKMLLTLWYFGDRCDVVKIDRIVTSLTAALSAKSFDYLLDDMAADIENA